MHNAVSSSLFKIICLGCLGYQLCDNSVGVLFNDYTRLIMYADGDSLQYIDKTAAESYLSVRSYPPALNKKVGLHHKHFLFLLVW